MHHPLQELHDAREAARKEKDPLAEVVYLSTITPDGYPATRPVFSREISDQGVCPYLSERSPKFEQLMSTGKGALTFHWHTTGRVFRLAGTIEVLTNSGMGEHWPTRHPQARALAHFYEHVQAQSSVMGSRDVLTQGIDTLLGSPEINTLPATWQCVLLRPIQVECWYNGGESRLHQRHLYQRAGSLWQHSLLVP